MLLRAFELCCLQVSCLIMACVGFAVAAVFAALAVADSKGFVFLARPACAVVALVRSTEGQRVNRWQTRQ